MNIRPAKEADLTAIVNIYNQSIPDRMATADTKPVTVESRSNWYHNRSQNRPLWVATKNEEVVGWFSFQNFYGRPAYIHTAEISIYVATKYHHQGIGTQLLKKALARSPQLELTTLLGFVFAHNQPSINLFTRHGFKQWGYLPNVAVLSDSNANTSDTLRSLLILGLSLDKKKTCDDG